MEVMRGLQAFNDKQEYEQKLRRRKIIESKEDELGLEKWECCV